MRGIHCDLTLYFGDPNEDEIYSTRRKMCGVKKKNLAKLYINCMRYDMTK